MQGQIAGIAIKPEHRGPMSEVGEAIIDDKGLRGNVLQSGHRRVTLIAREQWIQVEQQLGIDLPWHTRRANVLIQGLQLGGIIGKRIRLGEAELHINGETEPCARMDQLYPGLRRALEPDCRGGVYGEVLKRGVIRIGDTVTVLDESDVKDE